MSYFFILIYDLSKAEIDLAHQTTSLTFGYGTNKEAIPVSIFPLYSYLCSIILETL
jgi:hypothetical protein